MRIRAIAATLAFSIGLTGIIAYEYHNIREGLKNPFTKIRNSLYILEKPDSKTRPTIIEKGNHRTIIYTYSLGEDLKDGEYLEIARTRIIEGNTKTFHIRDYGIDGIDEKDVFNIDRKEWTKIKDEGNDFGAEKIIRDMYDAAISLGAENLPVMADEKSLEKIIKK